MILFVIVTHNEDAKGQNVDYGAFCLFYFIYRIKLFKQLNAINRLLGFSCGVNNLIKEKEKA